MTPRRTKTFRMRPQPAEPLRVPNPHAAGSDAPAAQHWVAVPPEAAPPPPADHPPNLPAHVRKFGACLLAPPSGTEAPLPRRKT